MLFPRVPVQELSDKVTFEHRIELSKGGKYAFFFPRDKHPRKKRHQMQEL